MSDPFVIHARGLTRYFGSKAALDDLDLQIPRNGVPALRLI
jgi:ABC-type transporter Mla maintaining outer membrane lipid asymmetry ATPase subunit MlaF